jgi:hypothetical protein
MPNCGCSGTQDELLHTEQGREAPGSEELSAYPLGPRMQVPSALLPMNDVAYG